MFCVRKKVAAMTDYFLAVFLILCAVRIAFSVLTNVSTTDSGGDEIDDGEAFLIMNENGSDTDEVV